MSDQRNATEFAPAWVSSPDRRGTGQVLFSNILTLGLCVFTAIHLNIPVAGTTELQYWLLKCKWVLITAIFPEVTLYTAGKHWFTANRLRKKLHRHCAKVKADPEACANPDRIGSEPFLCSQSVTRTTATSQKAAFSMTYAHYTVMGGFVTDVSHLHDSLSRLTISPKGVAFLAKHGHFLHFPEAAIRDKSKADLLAKTLICIQVTWQVVQIIARRAVDLPMTLLEVHIFIHVVCALAIYGLWWHKPLDVIVPTAVDNAEFQDLLALMLMRNYGFGQKAHALEARELSVPIRATGLSHHNGSEGSYLCMCPKAPDKSPSEESSNDRAETKSRQGKQHEDDPPQIMTVSPSGDIAFSVKLPPHIPRVCKLASGQFLSAGIGPAPSVCSLARAQSQDNQEAPGPLLIELSAKDVRRWKLAAIALERINEELQQKQGSINYLATSAPNIVLDRKGVRAGFYGYFRSWASGGLIAALCVCSYYGVSHSVAWRFQFPTATERLLWRVACVDTLAGTVSLLALFVVAVYLHEHGLGSLVRAFRASERGCLPYLFRLVVLLGLLNVPLFLAARIFIVLETFVSLRRVPVGVYETVSWTNYFPHL